MIFVERVEMSACRFAISLTGHSVHVNVESVGSFCQTIDVSGNHNSGAGAQLLQVQGSGHPAVTAWNQIHPRKDGSSNRMLLLLIDSERSLMLEMKQILKLKVDILLLFLSTALSSTITLKPSVT